MAVWCARHHVVCVAVVAVVMVVHVLVVDRVVAVRMFVALGQMQRHTGGDQHRGDRERDAQPGRSRDERDRDAEERRGREDRRRARRSDDVLRAQVQLQAHAVAERAQQQQRQRVRERRRHVAGGGRHHARHRGAEKSLGADDLKRIEIGERAGEQVVERPRERGPGHQADAQHGRAGGKRGPDEDRRTDGDQQRGSGHAGADELAQEHAREPDRERRLERQQQGRGRAVGAAQARDQERGRDDGAEQRDQSQTPARPAQDGRVLRGRCAKTCDERGGERGAQIHQRARKERPHARASALEQRRGHAEEQRSESGERDAALQLSGMRAHVRSLPENPGRRLREIDP